MRGIRIIWNSLVNFINHALDSHCAHCEIKKRCQSCETYKVQLDILRNENANLLQSLIAITQPKPEFAYKQDDDEQINRDPIRLTHSGWRHKKAILESSSKVTAARMREAAKNGTTVSIEELEKAAGLNLEDSNVKEEKSNN